MSDSFKTIALAILTAIIVVTLLIGSVAMLGNFLNKKKESIETVKKQAIENNCAQYNSTTGEFEWIKK
jgi:phage-related minor tail protein